MFEIGSKVKDKYGVEMVVVGYTSDYAGILMIETDEVHTAEWHTEIDDLLDVKVGDVLRHAYYLADLETVK
ncbi:protein of unknown function (plasmid) [Candidatus Promineifilum breve]|jgi:hypothetical protein|uniref:Uncharacterized protein n=1 Tax=Candidatus Promineifilum breve TaxID=1806508 RepID=A0A170PK61_9CHLR|nr:hypothetical protein [Candidatus Promineifilum breve]CUS06413.1 protein of unknown function [Candidatus Promineifilum breve]